MRPTHHLPPARRLASLFVASAALLTAGACTEAPSEPGGPDLATADAAAALVFRQVSTWGGHTCGVTTGDRAYCWGSNRDGQLGIGSRDASPHPRPVAVLGGLRFAEIRAGAGFTCGRATDGRLFCWGNNSSGQIGSGGDNPRYLRPKAVAGGRRYTQLRVGHNHACAISTEGIPYCWGNNFAAQIGDGTRENRFAPVAIKRAGQTFVRLSAGASYTCAVTTGNKGYCWGNNTVGQLGNGNTFRRATPTPIAGGLSFRQVSAGNGFTCAVTTDDRAFCWGANQSGSLGNGSSTESTLTPVAVVGGLRFSGIDPGEQHTCGVTTDNRAYCWGRTQFGRLGIGDGQQPEDFAQPTPAAVVGGLRFDAVIAGASSTCGVTTGEAAYCWGTNFAGELGDGTTEMRFAPVAVVGP